MDSIEITLRRTAAASALAASMPCEAPRAELLRFAAAATKRRRKLEALAEAVTAEARPMPSTLDAGKARAFAQT